ncbi:MAG: FGGY family carbohydrate kinase [Acidimicrobiales bacterium]
MRALAIDVGSTSVRTALVDEHGRLSHVARAPLTVRTPQPGEVELDGAALAAVTLECARATLTRGGGCDAVGITNQRATTLLFDLTDGSVLGPALSWQDLRTVVDCLVLQGEGLRFAPNQSATKARWLLEHAEGPRGDWRVATIETWLAWRLSEGDVLVADRTNASVTGLARIDLADWDEDVLERLGLERSLFATLGDSLGEVGRARALPGAPPITALIGDQPASLMGQGCVREGAKLTLGTGAIANAHGPGAAPASAQLRPSGCYPTALLSVGGVVTWGLEGIVLSAGSCVDWMVELGLVGSPAEADARATLATSDGVSFVPALAGLGTPWWDFGARGAFVGLTRGTSRDQLVRAVLEGVAQRGADLVEAFADEGVVPAQLRVDGGVSASATVVGALADLTGLPVGVSAEREATARGAGLLALVGAGLIALEDLEDAGAPERVVEPRASDDERLERRERWRGALEVAKGSIPELSAIAF